MLRKLIAAVLRFVHEQRLLLQLANYLESQPAELPAEPEGEHGEPAAN